MKENKYILITGCSGLQGWYAKRIGNVYTLKDEVNLYYRTIEGNLIIKADAVPVTLHRSGEYVSALSVRTLTDVFYWVVNPRTDEVALKKFPTIASNKDGWLKIEATNNAELIAEGILALKSYPKEEGVIVRCMTEADWLEYDKHLNTKGTIQQEEKTQASDELRLRFGYGSVLPKDVDDDGIDELNDGIEEAEQVIKNFGGSIKGSKLIKVPTGIEQANRTKNKDFWDAVEFLIDEWKYKFLSDFKPVQKTSGSLNIKMGIASSPQPSTEREEDLKMLEKFFLENPKEAKALVEKYSKSSWGTGREEELYRGKGPCSEYYYLTNRAEIKDGSGWFCPSNGMAGISDAKKLTPSALNNKHHRNVTATSDPRLLKAGIPQLDRRFRLDLNTPEEMAIRNAMEAVEKMGADERLTDSVVALLKAKDHLSDFIENKHAGDLSIKNTYKHSIINILCGIKHLISYLK